MSTKSPELFLSADQRALLLAALNSNTPLNSQPRSTTMSETQNADLGDSSFDNSLFADADADALADAEYGFDLDNYGFDLDTPNQESNGNEHEKRKLSIDDDEDEEADPHETEPKRREGDDKTAKKPGRKPITNEPTSKRKAQNRAAQRAFRERKEKHLKDLEQKVQDLEKTSESTSQENKALKQQVEKLQTELKDYRKRLSLGASGSGINRSPSNSVSNTLSSLDNNLGTTGGFNFDFPLFGSFAQPGQNVVGGSKSSMNNSSNRGINMSPTSYRVSPEGLLQIDRGNRNSLGSMSPHGSNNSPVARSNPNNALGGSNQQSPLQVHRVSLDEPTFPSHDILSDLFSPSILQAVNNDPNGDYMNKGASFSSSQSTPHMSSLFSFSDSPSASSVSQQSMKNGQNSSSCGTTPEAMDVASPPSQNKADASKLNSITEEGRIIPQPENTTDIDNSFAWLATQNGGNFDTTLFNDYRDAGDQFHTNNTNSVGMSYFDDAFPSAFDLALPPTPPASNIDKTKTTAPGLNEEDDEEEEEVVPAEDPNSLLKCGQIWDKIQSHPKFASGEIDMDNLCTELRIKAKCSESGVVVDKKDVEKILNKPVPSLWGL